MPDHSERLIENWRRHELKIVPGCSDAQLDRFERSFSIKLPDDFRIYYRRTNGMGPPGQDKAGFAFWSLDSIQPALLALKDAGAHAKPRGADDYYVFADYLDWSWAYAIRLTRAQTDNPVALIGKENLEIVAHSFSEFIELYLCDSPQLYGA